MLASARRAARRPDATPLGSIRSLHYFLRVIEELPHTAVTTRGMKEPEMRQIGRWIAEVLHNLENETVFKRVCSEVEAMTERFPLYEKRRQRATAGRSV